MNIEIFGIRIEISYLFACAVVLFIASDRTGILIPMTLSILLHEVTHLFFLNIFGSKVETISFAIGKLGVKYSGDISKLKLAISVLSGPFANLILAFIGLSAKSNVWFCVNIILAFYNFLPAMGLDGGTILELILGCFLKGKTVKIILVICSAAVSIIFCVGFVIISLKDGINFSASLFVIYLVLPLVLKKLG